MSVPQAPKPAKLVIGLIMKDRALFEPAGVELSDGFGAVDMVNFGPRDTVPSRFRSRQFHEHNPTVTLMRTTPEENAEIGRRIAQRLREAKGPLEVILPLRGVSAIAKEGGPFHDPKAVSSCIEAIRKGAGDKLAIREVDTDINDPEFARVCAETLLSLMQKAKSF